MPSTEDNLLQQVVEKFQSAAVEHEAPTRRIVINHTDFSDALLVALFHLDDSFYATGSTLRKIGHIGYALFEFLNRPGGWTLDIWLPPGKWEYTEIENDLLGRIRSLCGDSPLTYSSDGFVRLTQNMAEFVAFAYRIPPLLDDWLAVAREANDQPL